MPGPLRRANVLYLFAAVLFMVTVALSAFGPRSDETGLTRSASVYDEGPGGTAVMRRWLEGIGARTRIVQGDRFATEGVAVLFVLGVSEPLTPADVGTLRDFARGGGTLVVGTDVGFAETLLFDAYGVDLVGVAPLGEHETVGPATSASVARRISIDRGQELDLGERALPVVRTARGPLAAVVPEGDGLVYFVGSLAPFLSGQIADADNGRFVLALADGAIRSGGVVAFDEYHHGSHPQPDILAVLLRTWPGRALLLAGALVFAYVVLTGRRLGAPVPLDPRPARSSLDHVRAFAGLVRRSGHGEIARERLRRELRSGIARELGADPGMPAERLLTSFGHASAERAREARDIDSLLSRPLRDADLLRTVRRIDRVLHPEGEG